MTHTAILSDEQSARLQAAAQSADATPDTMLANLLNWLPAAKAPLSAEAYTRRWDAFWKNVVGSIEHGQPLTSEEMENVIGEEIADEHADSSL